MSARGQSSELAQIEWRNQRWSEEGYVGGFSLFSVGYGTTRKETMYYLSTVLPLKGPLIGQVHEDIPAAKAAAEKVLAEFVARITTPPDSAATS